MWKSAYVGVCQLFKEESFKHKGKYIWILNISQNTTIYYITATSGKMVVFWLIFCIHMY